MSFIGFLDKLQLAIDGLHRGAAYNPQWKHMNVPGTQPSVTAQLLTDEVTQQYPIQAVNIV